MFSKYMCAGYHYQKVICILLYCNCSIYYLQKLLQFALRLLCYLTSRCYLLLFLDLLLLSSLVCCLEHPLSLSQMLVWCRSLHRKHVLLLLQSLDWCPLFVQMWHLDWHFSIFFPVLTFVTILHLLAKWSYWQRGQVILSTDRRPSTVSFGVLCDFAHFVFPTFSLASISSFNSFIRSFTFYTSTDVSNLQLICIFNSLSILSLIIGTSKQP